MLTGRVTGFVRRAGVKLNPFCGGRKRPPIFRNVPYTKEVLKGSGFDIGDYTYGVPTVIPHPGSQGKLRLGKFCSIAACVTIMLGGEHRTNLISTYPFLAFLDQWPEAGRLGRPGILGKSKGDVVVGNDVWIGRSALILSGVTIGDGAVWPSS